MIKVYMKAKSRFFTPKMSSVRTLNPWDMNKRYMRMLYFLYLVI